MAGLFPSPSFQIIRQALTERREQMAHGKAELRSYPISASTGNGPEPEGSLGIVVPLKVMLDGTEMSSTSTTTIFGTAVDVTLSELAIETFFAVDDQTRDLLMQGYSHSIVPGGLDVMS